MDRCLSSVRPDWESKVASIGLTYHTHETSPYWDESAYYRLSSEDVHLLESAGNEVHRLSLQAAEVVIERGWWDRLGIPSAAVSKICESWEKDDFSLYGRFDFAFDGLGPPKLLEYNADTPTALIEAAVAQWFWLQDCFPNADQFNSIHERLIAAWKRSGFERVHFCGVSDYPEDEQTLSYLADTALQAGVRTTSLSLTDVGWDSAQSRFVDLSSGIIEVMFKLYPWEWMWRETFAQHLPQTPTRFLEPPWKMLLSNKGLLPVLWELFPDHPNLLPSYLSPRPLSGNYVQKPMLGREGQNIRWVQRGREMEKTSGPYGAEGYVYQASAECRSFDGHWPIAGVWIIDHEAAGVGFREDRSRITGNLSRFVPHLF